MQDKESIFIPGMSERDYENLLYEEGLKHNQPAIEVTDLHVKNCSICGRSVLTNHPVKTVTIRAGYNNRNAMTFCENCSYDIGHFLVDMWK